MRPNSIIPKYFKDIISTEKEVSDSISIIVEAFRSIGIGPHSAKEDVYIAFSGGKDSIVIADIATKYFGINRGVCETSFCLPNHIADFKKVGAKFSDRFEYKDSLSWEWLSKNPQYIFPIKSIRGKFYSIRQQKTISQFGAGDNINKKIFKACITGRRGQENTIKSKYYDKKGCLQIHPLAKWKTEHIWSYILANNLFYPALYDTDFGIEGASSWIALFDEHYVNGRIGCWNILFEQDKDYFENVLIYKVSEAMEWYNLYKNGKKIIQG